MDSQPVVPSAVVDGVVLDVPGEGDAGPLGKMHLLSWQETYPNAGHGIDAEWISEHIGFLASPAADDFRRRLFAAQGADPEMTFYRVARACNEVVGFVHASRPAHTIRTVHELVGSAVGDPEGGDRIGDDATLEALYLLRDQQGTGLADRMMAAALDWLAGQAMRLEVASYNARAISFYQRYDFRLTGESTHFRERVPIAAMRRAGHH